ncbi:cytosolic Fe-S cluster assembly factor NAR1, putative [Plasmodium berghei]|uniref:Cytosolic Fe-S cluster assembly factor NAR1, putative n=2 Tax=Plasmodium berghei TaxID=5821 RepID=A0A509AGD8_PLABA|nr:cytosolic Fe-S cluster assembly factor NAR1, putative [Plasmodium berghei ANKA]CXH83735.1 cytosolic Fe-S cluster assembly factor NAR1, putative [Plasmodium berghei]SCM19283.1 cytosolic Fe-S cluster assembly factor NAR1, putative [Plasmodium berghei]SCN21730.1 cytosolic Fe-S cluster assembly factor NAR1, putative [Plasmodium berghei]SCO58945.1 cytosolic Fe-S cluster assembly factor NAR1, putative [Plasmodium berghei]SCO58991.1 cytosolic Fe-S cluster assembly factor NAR1, putative [Plasmodium|eukprot:XP_034419725.1 cytosolic Fe-S cluster assembly factor NAR1, putative [Plasmodium berghei ANKA]
MFSNAIKLENLNDYFNDAEECIKPFLYTSNVNENKIEKPNLININKKKNIKNVKNKNNNERGEISLTDCLACSGCVTNEETNFLKNQNAIEILNNLKKKKINIISLSLQSLTALSVYYKLPIHTTQKKLCFFFKSLNFDYVYDSSLSELIALDQAKHEFLSYFYKKNPDLYKQTNPKLNTTHALSSDAELGDKLFEGVFKKIKNKVINNEIKRENYHIYQTQYNQKSRPIKLNNDKELLNNYEDSIDNKWDERYPVICAHCTGSVIYGEKKLDNNFLNAFSKLRSSQDIQGIILKLLHAQNNLYAYSLLKKQLINTFFDMYKYKLKFIKSFEKYYLKNNKLLKSTNNNEKENNPTNSNKAYEYVPVSIYEINHVYLLYCFDKKLESQRNNISQKNAIDKNIATYLNYFSLNNIDNHVDINSFYNTTTKTNLSNSFYSVDSVLTTIELIELINKLQINFYALPEINIDNIYSLFEKINKFELSNNNTNIDTTNFMDIKNYKENKIQNNFDGNPALQKDNNFNESLHFIYKNMSDKVIRCSNKNNISMGYGEEIFKYVCNKIYDCNINENNFNFKYNDIVVLSLYENDTCVFRVVLSYGFKSMYSVLKKIKEGKYIKRNEIKKDVEKIYNIKITYNLHFNGQIDYVELMACEKGCLFGCAQNIFDEYDIPDFSTCSCYNLNIFKKVAEQTVIQNFDFLSIENTNKNTLSKNDEIPNYICCSSSQHKASCMNKLSSTQIKNNENKKTDKEKLFQVLYNQIHNDEYTKYVNSKKSTNDLTINSFLNNIFNIFNTKTFHIFKTTLTSKKKMDIINW